MIPNDTFYGILKLNNVKVKWNKPLIKQQWLHPVLVEKKKTYLITPSSRKFRGESNCLAIS